MLLRLIRKLRDGGINRCGPEGRKKRTISLALLCLLAILLPVSSALAALQDFGPVNAANGFPLWYRDKNNVPLELCLSAAISTNLLNPGPMCIMDAGLAQGGNFNQLLPVAFPLNFPTNPLYFDASAQIQTLIGNFNAQYSASVEGGFGAGGGLLPMANSQTVFMTITMMIDAPIAGVYTVTHPYGTQTFNVAIPGPQAIIYQAYSPLVPAIGNFTGALTGPIGPFLQWTPTLPPPIGVEQFIGDPNVPHAVTGSPTGNNIFKIVGPVGSNLDGLGGTTVSTNLFTLTGKISALPIAVSSLTAAPVSPQAAGTSVTFTAAANGGAGPLEYRFSLTNGATSTIVQPYSTNPTWNWNTSGLSAGAYTVRVDTRQVGTTVMSSANSSITYNLSTPAQPSVTVSSLTASPTSPQNAGTPVTFTATASGGGTSGLQYRFTVGSTVAQQYGSSNTFTWNTTGVAAGTYPVKVDVRPVGATVDSAATQTINYVINVPPAPPTPLTLSSVIANIVSPQVAGAPITFTANASGGTSPLQYRFTLLNGNVSTIVQDYSAANSWTWNSATASGAYTVQVDVASAGSTQSAATQKMAYTITVPNNPVVTLSSLNANLASPQTQGASVTFTAAGTNSQGGGLEYQYTLIGKTSSIVQNYSANPSWTWNTAGITTGLYTVQVDARPAGSTVQSAATRSISYAVNAPQIPAVTISSLTVSPLSPQNIGALVTFSAAAAGGTGSFEYQFSRMFVSQGSGAVSTVVQPYSANASWAWNTANAAAGLYAIQVDVRPTGGTTSSASQSMAFTLTTTPPTTTGPAVTTVPGVLSPVLDPAAQPKFVNELPDILAPSYQAAPQSGPDPAFDYYTLSIREFPQDFGLRNSNATGTPLLPPVRVWGYGDSREVIDANGNPTGTGVSSGFHTSPGPTFVRNSTIGNNPGRPIKIVWSNELPGGPDYHLMSLALPSTPSMVAVDTTMMCGPNAPYCRPFNRVIPHVHGGHNYDYSDGIPEEWFSPLFAVIGSQFWTPPNEQIGTFTYPLDQTMANLWYHDHATGITRLNVNAGLFGDFLLRDATENSLISSGVLPAYPYEVPLAVQDKTFTWNATTGTAAIAAPQIPLSDPRKIDPSTGKPCVQGSMNSACWVLDALTGQAIPSITPEAFGNMIVVNGKTWPFKNVEPRKYRLRLLDATDSRAFFFQLQNRSTNPPTPLNFLVVGTEQGLLPTPVTLSTLILQPGERSDVIVDFTNLPAGTQVVLTNVGPEGAFSPVTLPVNTLNPPPPPPIAPANTTGQIMAFNVSTPLNTAVPNASVTATTTLTGPIPTLPAAVKERSLVLQEFTDKYGRTMLKTNGMGYLDPTTDVPVLNSTEIWDFVNLTPDVHPMHIHLVKFQVVNREDLTHPAVMTNPPSVPATWTALGTFKPIRPEEQGWKDTIQTYPSQITRVKATYDVPGIFIHHCHILSHEEYDKMRHYDVTMQPTAADLLIFRGPTGQSTGSPQAVVFHAMGLTGLTYPLPPQSHAFEFQFSVQNPAGVWTVVQPFSDFSNFVWNPAGKVTGTYNVKVDLRIPTTTTIVASQQIPYTLWGPAPKTLTITPANSSRTVIAKMLPATFSAIASPAGLYQYRFSVQAPGSTTWTIMRDYTTSASWSWTLPSVVGVYNVKIDSRAVGSTADSEQSVTTTYTLK